jgi:hypothetical protein
VLVWLAQLLLLRCIDLAAIRCRQTGALPCERVLFAVVCPALRVTAALWSPVASCLERMGMSRRVYV